MPKNLTTGDIRAKLIEAIDKVMDGSLDPNKAAAIAKLAGQINASLIAEVEAAKAKLFVQSEQVKLGDMVLGTGQMTIEQKPLSNATIDPANVAAKNVVAPPLPASMGRVIDRRTVGNVDLGDPAPGRSALDKIRASAEVSN